MEIKIPVFNNQCSNNFRMLLQRVFLQILYCQLKIMLSNNNNSELPTRVFSSLMVRFLLFSKPWATYDDRIGKQYICSPPSFVDQSGNCFKEGDIPITLNTSSGQK